VKRSGPRTAGLALPLALGLLVAWTGSTSAQFNMAGPQIWNCEYWQTLHIGDYYGPNFEISKLKPIRMTGCRNGHFSGYVVVTCSTMLITDLKATMSDLVAEGGAKIAKENIRVRFAELAKGSKGYQPPYRFNALLEEAPEEIPTVDMRSHRKWKPRKAGPIAMQPVWVTVVVPKEAAPGKYAGKLTLQSENLEPFAVPVEIRVHGWTLPEPKEFHVQNLAFYSPERVALRYDVERWSDEHLKYMRKSLELMLQVGSRQIILDLVRRYPARDNNESMVKWIKQKDGSFTYDFTAVEKYLDLAGEVIGKPFPIRLNMWCAVKEHTSEPEVTVVDAATGEKSALKQPPYGTPESLAFWKPVLGELRKRIEKRGWFDSVVVNWMNYCGGPDAGTVKVLHDIWPDGKWSSMDHGRRRAFSYGDGKMPVVVSLAVWNEGSTKAYSNWDKKSSPGPRNWRNSFKPGHAVCAHARNQHWDYSVLWVLRELAEHQIMKGCDGCDVMGADLWPAQDARGRWRGGKWTHYALGPGNSTTSFIAPGKDGAQETERFEALREGVQIAEAMIFIQRAIDAKKVSGEVAAKGNLILDDRARHFMAAWEPAGKAGKSKRNYEKVVDGAFELDDRTYEAAAAVAAALK